MGFTKGRYSWLLRPILLFCDLLTINLVSFQMLNFNTEKLNFFDYRLLNNQNFLYAIYSIVFWLSLSGFTKFYHVYRYTSPLKIFSLLLKQFSIYFVIVLAFIGVFRSIDISVFVTLRYLLILFLVIASTKFLSYYALKLFRSNLKGNLRNVLVVGYGDVTIELIEIFKSKKELGYNIKGISNDSKQARSLIKTINDCYAFLKNDRNIDEIYCAIDELKDFEITHFIQFAEKNRYNIKFIPNTSKIITKRLKTDYYNYLPVLSLQEVSLNSAFNKVIKQIFDVLFALAVIIFVISWLSVVLFILMKIESKGPLFYRHKRHGISYKEFYCFKYRSLNITKEVKGTYVKKNDTRLTKIGQFLRKTSLDELPQFINVLKGEMSVVGPRPHMLSYTQEYSKVVDKYNFMFRHNVKPGITGLAQISGFRGEIKTEAEIINRIKYDNFYIENWSLLLDIKIIIQTIINMFKGEKKAY